jgi:uncharacterized membrane protein YdjX (TVP38/TMEM64 family)
VKRIVWLVVIVGGLFIASKFLLEDLLGFNLGAVVEAQLEDAGIAAGVVIVGVLAVDLFLPVPSSVVMILSGVAFGVPLGATLSFVGSLIGNLIGFETTRRYGHAVASSFIAEDELHRLHTLFERNGAVVILITRPVPVVMETTSLVAGLSGMRRSTFVAASAAGTIPVAILYAYAGAVTRAVGNVVPALVIMLAVGGGAWLLWRRGR